MATVAWRKRSAEDTAFLEIKRPRQYYYRLESESSRNSVSSDTESVYSIQDKETDVVRDTSDTEFDDEFELDTLTESDEQLFEHSSSGSEDMVLAAAAAVMCDSSLDTWATDEEDSDDGSSEDDVPFGRTDYWICIQCKSQNNNPLFRYCDKCFQSCRQCKNRKTYKCFPLCSSCFKDRKTFFPPRPRRHKKATKSQDKTAPKVELDVLKSCLSGLSQDSGLGSSQECPSLDLEKIVVPEQSSTDVVRTTNKRKRHTSESSLSEYEAKKPKRMDNLDVLEKKEELETITSNSTIVRAVSGDERLEKKEEIVAVSSGASITKDILDNEKKREASNEINGSKLCLFCNSNPVNSVFMHGKRFAHSCCCYKCAMRTWKSIKRCPMCNGKVNNVVKVFSM